MKEKSAGKGKSASSFSVGNTASFSIWGMYRTLSLRFSLMKLQAN